MSRYYTVEEANQTLPQLELLVTELIATHNRILAARHEIESVLAKSQANSGSVAAGQVVLDFTRLERLMHQINELGVEVKDITTGLCDFVALHQGREVYLCWRYGEPQVAWWHELHTGFAGRRPVSELA